MKSGAIARRLLFALAGSFSLFLALRTDAQVVGAGPVRQLWRQDLANISYGTQYEATSVVLNAEDDLFVGGSVRLSRPYPQRFPFIAKFDPSGTKLWELWPPNTVEDLSVVEGMASDGQQGVYAAFSIVGGGVRLARISSRGPLDYVGEQLTNCWVTDPSYRPAVNSVHLAPDGQKGFYFLGLLPQDTNQLKAEFTLSRYDQTGQKVWSTNVFRGGFWGGAGLERALVTTSNSIYFCGLRFLENPFEVDSQLVKVGTNGTVLWAKSSLPRALWHRLAVLDDETVCVSGNYNYDIWSADGTRLASHGTWGFNTVARQGQNASGFLVSDFNSANLLRLDPAGRIKSLGQIPAETSSMGAVELLGIAPDRWLVAAKCREGFSSYTNNLSLFEFGESGELKWRQRLPGFEYATRSEAQPGLVYLWLLKGSDGSVRLVVNLNFAPANPHLGVAVAAFSVTNDYSAPRIISTSPLWTNINEGVEVAVEATGNGPLRFEWHFFGNIRSEESTNASMLIENLGVYCARILDDTGESVSPAFNLLQGGQPLSLRFSQGQPLIRYTPGYAVEFHLETSSDLAEWSSDQTVYSWIDAAASALVPPPENAVNRFFRARLLAASEIRKRSERRNSK